jgi:tRNA dimethylallyltransferase
MVASGLSEEAASLLPFRNNKALQTVGYREMFEYLDGQITLEEAEKKIAQNTRNYAKRQLTWFKKYPEVFRIIPGESDLLIQRIQAELHQP